MSLEVPKRRYFDFAFPCHYRRRPPEIDGRLKDWPRRFLVPDLTAIEGREPFADVWMAWNEAGLYFAVRVAGKTNPITVHPADPAGGDSFEVWLSTRDVRTVHQANRYCHQFTFLPRGGGRGGREPLVRPVPIVRAPEKGMLCDPSILQAAAQPERQGYVLEIAIPSEALHGFDPAEHPRLGFTYHVHDTHRGDQSWTVSKDFRFQDRPSMWGTGILTRGG
ncbi:MAG: hypothetical protein HYU36_11050 [Planctomycetes bacterium]|nr:hypothetical protein [Planctomycetota bacterium]